MVAINSLKLNGTVNFYCIYILMIIGCYLCVILSLILTVYSNGKSHPSTKGLKKPVSHVKLTPGTLGKNVSSASEKVNQTSSLFIEKGYLVYVSFYSNITYFHIFSDFPRYSIWQPTKYF